MKLLFTFIVLISTVLIFTGCAEEETAEAGNACSSHIEYIIDELGEAEEINKYDSGDYHSHSYWYWSIGFSRTFTWGGPVEGCEISDYTFSPISS